MFLEMSHLGIFRRRFFSHLPNPIYLRMLGYVVTLTVHLITFVTMTNRYQGEILKDPDVAFFIKYHHRLLTVLNVFLQAIYAVLGLSCDVLTIGREVKYSGLLKTLKNIRDHLFSILVFPSTMTIFTIFWTVINYDAALLIRPGVAKVVLPIENFLVHTFIALVVLWEIVCRPRKVPTSHLFNLAMLFFTGVVFTIGLFITYYETNDFMYPVLNKSYVTPYFWAFLGLCFILCFINYVIQWCLTELLWRKRKETAKKIK